MKMSQMKRGVVNGDETKNEIDVQDESNEMSDLNTNQ